MKVKNINTEQWLEKFKPIQNQIDEYASWENHEGKPCMFETFGKELEFVREKAKQNPNCIWTLMDSDEDDDCIIVEGFHFVNRLGYFITEIPFENNVNYVVKD